MSFILEVVKNGKDIILFNDYKYRESYCLKIGDIVWKCLGKSCKASIKTNKEKTIIFASNDTHTGLHPVTLRSLTPTARGVAPSTPRTEPELSQTSQAKSTENMETPVTVSLKIDANTTENSASPEVALIRENAALREELAKLREERQMILDHSIESDLRLLQYTEDVFSPPQSLNQTQEEKRQGRSPTNDCLDSQEAISEERNMLLKERSILKASLSDCNDRLKQLNLDYNALQLTISEKECLVAQLNKSIENHLKKQSDLNEHIISLNKQIKTIQNTVWSESRWLDDKVLEAYFVSFSDYAKSYCKSKCIFVGPTNTLLIKYGSNNDVKQLLIDIGAAQADFVFCCVSDFNQSHSYDSGSHWSLLFIDITTNTAYHLDSLPGYNLLSATEIGNKLSINNIVDIPCVKQNNSFECGLRVLVNAKFILEGFCCRSVGYSNTLSYIEWYNEFCKASLGTPQASIVKNSKCSTEEPVSNIDLLKWETVKNKKKRQKITINVKISWPTVIE